MFPVRRLCAFISLAVILIVSSGHGSEIINGKEVQPHSLPFMALLASKTPTCGGVLIDPKWVLTAAHCTKVKTVLLGVHSIKGKERKYRQTRKVKRSEPHPYYDSTKNTNDLMLLELDKAVKPTKWVSVLKLNEKVEDPKAGSRCQVAGWGRTDSRISKMSDTLMAAIVTVIDRKKCNSTDYYNSVITKSMICAGSDGKNVADTCKGDSGGPILCKGVLVGVTSFGDGCGIQTKPGVYSFLTENHLHWIKKTMKKAEIYLNVSLEEILL